MDTISKSERSLLMGRIRGKNTQPEMVVRSILHRLGYRFRLHVRELPGCPDIVLPRHHKAVLVQGCFWHGHGCRIASKPKSNACYWKAKIETNRVRDSRNRDALVGMGWKILELWECNIRKREGLAQALQRFMETD